MSALAPENTLAAFRACKEHGVNWFEFDVGLIADGTAAVIHDDTLDRTTDATGPVASLTAADLAHIDAGSWFSPEFASERIPTLRAVVDLMNEHEIDSNLEIKSGGSHRHLVSVVMTELQRLSPSRRLIISSFDPRILLRVHSSLPRWRRENRASVEIGFLFEEGKLAPGWKALGTASGATALHPDVRMLTAERVHKYKSAGFAVNTWTVNDPEQAQELAAWGVDGIFTDRAHEMPQEWRY